MNRYDNGHDAKRNDDDEDVGVHERDADDDKHLLLSDEDDEAMEAARAFHRRSAWGTLAKVVAYGIGTLGLLVLAMFGFVLFICGAR
ncbi:MAG: hypothetical protein H6729_02735 [Deltaproteobacteria bacterium]|nr:hypothetical protein [Deltaproteobacteria bacterium]